MQPFVYALVSGSLFWWFINMKANRRSIVLQSSLYWLLQLQWVLKRSTEAERSNNTKQWSWEKRVSNLQADCFLPQFCIYYKCYILFSRYRCEIVRLWLYSNSTRTKFWLTGHSFMISSAGFSLDVVFPALTAAFKVMRNSKLIVNPQRQNCPSVKHQ